VACDLSPMQIQGPDVSHELVALRGDGSPRFAHSETKNDSRRDVWATNFRRPEEAGVPELRERSTPYSPSRAALARARR